MTNNICCDIIVFINSERRVYLEIIKKLYGGIDITWKRLIIAAVAIGVLVGGIMLIPAGDNTSLKDIGTEFEWWVFFGTIIVANSKSPVDSAAKAFVFFLISQPLIYLVQVPFGDLGWGLFGYYKNWILWTLATIPMGAIGHFVKRGDAISGVILSGMTVMLAIHFSGYASSAIDHFPDHLVSAILCVVFIVVSILGIAKTKWSKLIAWGVAVLSVIVLTALVIIRGGDKKFTPMIGSNEYDLGLNSTSKIVSTTNLEADSIREVDGNYYIDVSMDQNAEGRIIINTDGVDTTYIITFDEERKSAKVEKE